MTHLLVGVPKDSRSAERLLQLNENLLNSSCLEDACQHLCTYLNGYGAELLSVKFQDSAPDGSHIRPYVNLPADVTKIGTKFSHTTGCPLLREAKRRLEAFDWCTIDKSHYKDFLDRRFLSELKKARHKHIAVVPVIVGRAIAQFNIGLRERPFEGQLKQTILESVGQTMPVLVKRFPAIASMFDKKHLSDLERQIIGAICHGEPTSSIGKELGVSDHLISAAIDSAMKKLQASNRFQMIFKATRLGEI